MKSTLLSRNLVKPRFVEWHPIFQPFQTNKKHFPTSSTTKIPHFPTLLLSKLYYPIPHFSPIRTMRESPYLKTSNRIWVIFYFASKYKLIYEDNLTMADYKYQLLSIIKSLEPSLYIH